MNGLISSEPKFARFAAAERSGRGTPGGGHPPRRVLFVIDQLRQLGGAERMLIETVKRLDPSRFAASIATFDLDLALPALNEPPVPVHFIPLHKTFHWHAVQAAAQLRHLFREERIDILHCFFETSDLWAAPIAKLCGCKVIVSSRRDMGLRRTRKHTIAYPVVNRVFSKVLTVSEQVRMSAITQEKLPPAKVETLYNGIDIEAIDALSQAHAARERFGIPAGSPLITLVANVRAVKGIDVLVRAAALIAPSFPAVKFAIAGKVLEAETMESLLHLISSLKLEDNFLFLGPVENPYPLLAESDIFVLPSRSEGFSNSLIEAMASGLPSVATRVGGNGEALKDGLSGFLVESEDHEALAGKLLRLLADPEAARRMGRQAREAAGRRFGIRAVIDRLMDIYDDLLEGDHG